MKTITYAQIKELSPCYDPVRYITIDWSGTLKDILLMKNVSAKDRMWVAVRHQFLTDKQIHLYGLGCARLAEKNTTDARVKACNDTVQAYLKGEATLEQLNDARSAAWSAWSAARSAAWSAWSAAESAARSAWSAWSAAESAAWSVAWSAARSVAWSAAESAAWSAARSAARSVAWSAARSAAEEEQCNILLNILETVIE